MCKPCTLALKIDVDTERGTRLGVPNLLSLLENLQIPATFYLSLGPDNTGRAIQRVFRQGFLKKVSRTNVISLYGIRTLLNGVLLPGPHIGRKHEKLLRSIKNRGFDVGIHAYDHQKWQDNLGKMSRDDFALEFKKAQDEFTRIFGEAAITAAAPGWQANEITLEVYDEASISYASDCRGFSPFYPRNKAIDHKVLQIPTTLPTLDELLGRPEFPLNDLINYYISLLKNDLPNILTIHPELEGMKYLDWFHSLLVACQKHQVEFKKLSEIAALDNYPSGTMQQGTVVGRTGMLAIQTFCSR